MITISCSTRCFPRENLDRALVRVAWAGFRGAELAPLSAGEPDAVPFTERLLGRLEAEELKAVAVDAGTIAFTSEATALDATALLGRCTVLAQSLDVPVVVAGTESAGGEGDPRLLAEYLGRLLHVLDAIPVTVALRHAVGSLIEGPDDFARLQERVGSPRLAFALDPAEALRTGWEPVSAVGVAFPGHVYLSDLADGEPAGLGTGEIDWEELAGALIRGGYRGAAALLPGVDDPLLAEQYAREACAFAQEVFQRVR
jgi:sugar phosphate isomerase/epimerase